MVSRNTTLTVVLTGDASQLRRVLGGAERDLSTLDRASGQTSRNVAGSFATLQSGYLGLTAAIAGAAAAAATAQAVMSGSITAASNLAEQQNKVNVVFGASAGAVNDFAQAAATSIAMSEREALQATGTFGNLFTAMGLNQSAAAGMSTEVTKLAADLSSFNNVPVADALAALQSGLVGETEPMRRFGVVINAATVEAKALQMGLAATKAEISESDKVMARYQLILEGTKNAQGDMARTMGSFANQQRQFAALWEQAQAAIGQRFLPVATEALQIINNMLKPTSDVSMAVSGLARAYDNLATALTAIPGAAALAEGAMKSFINSTVPGLSVLLKGIDKLAAWERSKQNAASSARFAANLSGDEEAMAGGRSDLSNLPMSMWPTSEGLPKSGASVLTARAGVTEEDFAKTIEAELKEKLASLGAGAEATTESLRGVGGAATTAKTEIETGLIAEARNLQSTHRIMEEAELAAVAATREFEESTRRAAQTQQWYASYLQGLAQQNVRFAPGVFEGLARQAGLTPLSDLIAGGATVTQTDLGTGRAAPVDVVVP